MSPIILDMINVIAEVEKALVVSKDQISYSLISKALTLFSSVKAERGEEAEVWSQQRLVHEVSEKKPSAWHKVPGEAASADVEAEGRSAQDLANS